MRGGYGVRVEAGAWRGFSGSSLLGRAGDHFWTRYSAEAITRKTAAAMRSSLTASVLAAVTLVALSASEMSLTLAAESWPAHITRLMCATSASASSTRRNS